MKVKYLPRNRLRSPYAGRLSVLLAVFVFGAIAFFFLDEVIISTISPVWKAENAVSRSLRNTVALFNSKQALISENAMLKEQLSSMALEMQMIAGSRVEESVILELVGRKQDSNTKLASLLTRPPQTPYDIIVIDAGTRDSITLGSLVFLPEGPALGVISEVFTKSSRVKLFSSNGMETNAILERAGVPVVLVGNGAGNFKFIIPREIEVEKGDRIISTGVISHLIATVEEINLQPTDSFKEVLAKSPTNIFTLRFVFVSP